MLNNKLKVYTPAEVAVILKVGKETVYRRLRTGKIKSIPGGQWRISVSALQDYINGVPIKKSSINKNDKEKSSCPVNTNSGLGL